MKNEIEHANKLLEFINNSPTAYHAVSNIKSTLNACGFIELKEDEKWNIKSGGKYYIVKNDSAIVAFIAGLGNILKEGFRIIAAHNDSPTFRIKPSAEMVSEGYIKLDTETYGGPILNTWLDRPLSAAGRVTLKSSDVLYPKTALINIKRPILIIPNISIHLNRKVNSGIELNKQKDMLPILALINDNLEYGNCLLNEIAKELSVNPSDIIDFDLFLYEFENGTIMGLNNEFISSSRLDDLEMVHAALTAIINIDASDATNVMVFFDNEEVGSSTKQGADSQFLSNILERIVLSMSNGGREEFFIALSKSFMISGDAAHAVHPNAVEKYDPQNKPIINKGPVIKVNANMKYTSDSNSSAVFASICEKANIPFQWFVNRSDEPGGSTIGPISTSHLDIRCVDVGAPILAMHSVRELGGVFDHTYITDSFRKFYGAE